MKNININTIITGDDGIITEDNLLKAMQVLKDNGIEADEATTVLRAIGYALLGTELFPVQEKHATREEVEAECKKWFERDYGRVTKAEDLEAFEVEDLENIADGQYPERAIEILDENGWPVDDGEIEFGADEFGWAMCALADLAEHLLYKLGIWDE